MHALSYPLGALYESAVSKAFHPAVKETPVIALNVTSGAGNLLSSPFVPSSSLSHATVIQEIQATKNNIIFFIPKYLKFKISHSPEFVFLFPYQFLGTFSIMAPDAISNAYTAPSIRRKSNMKDFSCFQNIDAIQQIFSADQLNTITMFEKGFNTFGMNLFAIPQDYGLWSPMILFPVICFASNVLTQFITMRINGKNNPMQQQQGCMKVMMYAMPLFSAYIAYIVPSAVAFYWIVSSLVSLVQSVIVGKLFSPQRMTATSEARHAALMFEQEALVQYNYVPHGLSESAEENTNSKKKKKK